MLHLNCCAFLKNESIIHMWTTLDTRKCVSVRHYDRITKNIECWNVLCYSSWCDTNGILSVKVNRTLTEDSWYKPTHF